MSIGRLRHQHRVGLGTRHQGALPHGQRDIGTGQHGRVVDTVADHGHAFAACLCGRHLVQLALRRGAAHGRMQLQLPRQTQRTCRAVARQQAELVTLRAQLCHRLGGAIAQRLVEAEDRAAAVVGTQVHRRGGLCRLSRGARRRAPHRPPTRARRAARSCRVHRGRAARARPPPRPGSTPTAAPAAAAATSARTRDAATTPPATPPPPTPAPATAMPHSAPGRAPAAACSAWVVSVPVLSMNSRSSRAMLSSASSRCTSTPRRARPPAAATSAAGAASDSAHGQVTMSTDTATHTARDGSITLQAGRRQRGQPQHRPQEGPGPAVGHARQRWPLAHGVAHHRDDGFVARVGADTLRPASSPARPGSRCRPPARRRAPWAPASIRR